MGEQLFKKFYRKMARQGMIKALLLGLAIAFGGLFVTATTLWAVGYKGLWICFVVFGALLIISTPILYYVIYRPDKKEIARRIDEVGLEERMITMYELEGNDSYIARRQREDALTALETVNEKLLKFVVAIPVIVVLCCMAVLGTGMTVVEGLYQSDRLGSLPGVLTPEEELHFFELSYDVEGEGFIDGEIVQLVAAGKNATPVMAEAEDGWVFVGWMVDGEQDTVLVEPLREDKAIANDMEIVAVFQEAEEGEGEGEGQGEGEGEGEGQQGEGQPQEGEGQQGEGEGDQPNPKPDQGDGAGGQYQENNQVIDGQTYYGGSTYDNAYGDAVDGIKGNDGLSDGEIGIGEGYFNTIGD